MMKEPLEFVNESAEFAGYLAIEQRWNKRIIENHLFVDFALHNVPHSQARVLGTFVVFREKSYTQFADTHERSVISTDAGISRLIFFCQVPSEAFFFS